MAGTIPAGLPMSEILKPTGWTIPAGKGEMKADEVINFKLRCWAEEGGGCVYTATETPKVTTLPLTIDGTCVTGSEGGAIVMQDITAVGTGTITVNSLVHERYPDGDVEI